jgi:hypothetical protein
MLKVVLILAGCLGVLIVGVLVFAATKPDTFRVARSASIKAPPDKIFPLIDDFRAWPQWSPYENKDPQMKRTFGATTAGKGAVYGWDGNSAVGSGRITITDTAPPSKVMIDLDMQRPITAHNNVVFTLEPQGSATKVTWAMSGGVPYFAKIMHVFFNMDTMVGGDFDAGLAKLKTIAEK